ncbi:MAG: diguanylate cyclase [Rhizobiales bacterium]|nr:diguanylate cyclase [Hyphomicrobiales bacterium]
MQIVLVDPSRTVRRIITDLVQQWEFNVCAFADGVEALSYIQHNDSVRVLLTSAELPSMSGVDLCVQARAILENRRPLYIIVMSSNDEYTKCVQALNNGADEFIRKPPIAEELRARLRTADRVTSLQSELVRLASTDYLTGLLNRRAFFENAAKLVAQARHGQAVSVVMFDLDHFKQINDTHGHDIGDAVLKRVAAEIAPLRGSAGRLGGEEFALLMEGELSDAVEVAQELRRSIEKLKIFAGEQMVAVTCSFGVAEWEAGDTIDVLLRRADMALYEAKRTGRNKVVVADSYALSDQHEKWRGAARTLRRPR